MCRQPNPRSFSETRQDSIRDWATIITPLIEQAMSDRGESFAKFYGQEDSDIKRPGDGFNDRPGNGNNNNIGQLGSSRMIRTPTGLDRVPYFQYVENGLQNSNGNWSNNNSWQQNNGGFQRSTVPYGTLQSVGNFNPSFQQNNFNGGIPRSRI
jgi:hypothetical protein